MLCDWIAGCSDLSEPRRQHQDRRRHDDAEPGHALMLSEPGQVAEILASLTLSERPGDGDSGSIDKGPGATEGSLAK